MNDEIASDKVLLNSYDTLCERKREEPEQLNKDISMLKLLLVDLRTMIKNILKSKRLLKKRLLNFLQIVK